MFETLIQAVLSGILLGGVYAVMASGLTLVFGVTKIIHIAHTVLILLGTYLTFTMVTTFGVDPFLTLIVTLPVLFALGLGLYRFTLEPISGSPQIASLLVLFGVTIAVQDLIGKIWSINFTAMPSSYSGEAYALGALSVTKARLFAFVVAIALMGALHLLLTRTDLGRAIRATSQDRDAARVIGVDVEFVSMIAFGLAAALAAAAGGMVAIMYSFYPALHWYWIGVVFSIVVLGGLGSVRGALVAAFIVGVVESLTSTYYATSWSGVVLFSILLLTLLLRPQGLFGERAGRLES